MVKKSGLVIILQITLALFVLPILAFADSPMPPKDYKKVTENNEYVFVMLAPDEWARYQKSGIRDVYKQSGTKRNWPIR